MRVVALTLIGGGPSLRFLQGWAAMLPAQLLSVLHRPLYIVMLFQNKKIVIDAELGRKYLQGQRIGEIR
jgi:hypothetical protein